MAVLSGVSPLYGARGVIGGLLFRTVGGRTIVSSHDAGGKKRRRTSALQQATRSRFADASRYAKTALRDAAVRSYYTKLAKKLGVTSAYTAAITDFMRHGAAAADKIAKAISGKINTTSRPHTENSITKGLPMSRHVLCEHLYNKANASIYEYNAISTPCSSSLSIYNAFTEPLYVSRPVVPT